MTRIARGAAKRKAKRRKKTAVVAPLGPPTNLRPAGAHPVKKKYSRRRNKEIAREAAEQE